MILNIQKTELSKKSRSNLNKKFGTESGTLLADRAEGLLQFCQPNMVDIKPRRAEYIRSDLERGREAISILLSNKDVLHHIERGYLNEYLAPHHGIDGGTRNVLNDQSSETALYRPAIKETNVLNADGELSLLKKRAERICAKELLQRINKSISYALAHVEEGPHKTPGRPPLEGQDQFFIRMLAECFTSITGKKAAYSMAGRFAVYIENVTASAGDFKYSEANLKKALKRS